MKKLLMVLLGIAWLSSQAANAQDVVSFKDWKSLRVQEVLSEIKGLEVMEKTFPQRFSPEDQSKLKQARANLEINQELNAQDYFILYLSPKFQNDQQAYTKAVQMMSPDEVAQILLSYDKLIEDRKKKGLGAIDGGKFGFSIPRKLDPSVVISSMQK